MAFGVYGDGPYMAWETGRHRRLLADAERSGIEWLIHVGDVVWIPCEDDPLLARRAQWEERDLPVLYTPGDNEWTDCHRERSGAVDPLERLAAVRRIFFSDPTTSLGGRPMPVASQAAASPRYADHPENALWERGGFVFATLHVVGSGNGMFPFPGRTSRHDEAVERRTAAAVAWMGEAFDRASAREAPGVVLFAHANVSLENGAVGSPYRDFVQALERRVAGFPGPVLFVHGDSHVQRTDRPLADSTGAPHANFTRVETFGSPDVGWVRIVVDTVSAEIVSVEPRPMRGWF